MSGVVSVQANDHRFLQSLAVPQIPSRHPAPTAEAATSLVEDWGQGWRQEEFYPISGQSKITTP